MGVTDYHSYVKEEMARISLIAHEVELAKHKRRERILAVALVLSLLVGTLNLLI